MYTYNSEVKLIRGLYITVLFFLPRSFPEVTNDVFLYGYAATYWFEVCLTSAVNAVWILMIIIKYSQYGQIRFSFKIRWILKTPSLAHVSLSP